jgi:hypothetical protein
MRTTVTTERDVEKLLREAMHRSRKGFQETLNDAVRVGFAQTKPHVVQPFAFEARPLELRAGLDPAGFNKLVDDLDVDAFPHTTQGLAKK